MNALRQIAKSYTVKGVTFYMIPFRNQRFDALVEWGRGQWNEDVSQWNNTQATFVWCEGALVDMEFDDDAPERYRVYADNRIGSNAEKFELFEMVFAKEDTDTWYEAYKATRHELLNAKPETEEGKEKKSKPSSKKLSESE